MSIAFITLIFGFLLGKFTSDRNYIIKEKHKHQQEVTSRPSQSSQNDMDKLISSVIDAAREKLTTNSNFKEEYLKGEGAKKIVSSLGNNFTTCLSEFRFDSEEEDLEDFLRHLLKKYYDSFENCVKELRTILL